VSKIEINRKPEVRPDFVPVDAYVSREYVELEKQRLWPRTWLLACREEEVENVGDYVTFDIADESILILRSDQDTVSAFYNVCQHRGRRLKDDYSGNTGKQLVCGFHGWRYRLSGEVLHIVDEQDWAPCPQFQKEKLGLKPVRMETWGGWIFVSMDPDIEPLADYLAPIPEMTGGYEFEKLRIGWHQAIIVPCNWKVVVDAFNEAYHAWATHSTSGSTKSPSWTAAHGKHGTFTNVFMGDVPDDRADIRQGLLGLQKWQVERAKCMATPESIKAAERVQDLPEGTPNRQIYDTWLKHYQELMEAKGSEWPKGLTREYLASKPTDWHIFPNSTVVPAIDAVLWHRMRPWGDDPAMCIWDIWSLDRLPAGTPRAQRQFFPAAADFKGQNPFLEEDFSNMQAVQKGMLSRGFEGARTSPVQEVSVSNFHKTLYDYLHGRS
jgi:phenylpropionate dioxygenase-like ring-hydroxylating dioxygenase large terminal subunit